MSREVYLYNTSRKLKTEYDALMDPHLVNYFEKSHRRKILKKNHLINKTGVIQLKSNFWVFDRRRTKISRPKSRPYATMYMRASEKPKRMCAEDFLSTIRKYRSISTPYKS